MTEQDSHSEISDNSEFDPLLTQQGPPNQGDRRRGLGRASSTNLVASLRNLVSAQLYSEHDSEWAFAGWQHRLFGAAIIIAVLIAVSIKLQYADRPDEYNDKGVTFDFQTNLSAIPDLELWDQSYTIEDSFRVETHSHTSKSDGNMTPKQLVQWAYAYGFNALFLSDHNNLNGVDEAHEEADRLGLVVVPAMEYTCCRIHMNLVNVTNATALQPVTWPSDKELQRVIKETHAQGGYVVVNHLPWSLQTEYGYHQPVLPRHPSIDDLLDWGVDSFESVHDNTIDLRMLRMTEQHNRAVIASNDIHYAAQPAYVWTTLSRASLSDGVITGDDILKELFIKKKSTFMFSATGAAGRAYPSLNRGLFQYAWFAPLTTIQFGWLFTERKGMYSFTGEFCHEKQFELHVARIVWFLIWCFLGFGVFEVIRSILVILLRKFGKSGRSDTYRMV